MKVTFTLELESPAGWGRRGVCAGCGCTDNNACGGGCAWVDDTRRLCSACFEALAGHDRFDPAQRDHPLQFSLTCTQAKS